MADESVADPPETMDDFQPQAHSSMNEEPSGKRVTVSSSEPDVFNFTPDSLEVKQVEKPPKPAKAAPRAEGMPEAEQDRIMRELKGDLEKAQQRVTDQKLKLQRIAYILDKLQNGMSDYQTLLKDKFTKFLVNNEVLQTEWFGKISRQLPVFGDYTLVLAADSEELVGQDGLAGRVHEGGLLRLVDDIVTNLYGAGSLLKHHATLCRNIDNRLAEKTSFLEEQSRPFPRWKATMEGEDAKFKELVQEHFSVTSKISFLGLRDPPTIPPLDVSLNKSRANASFDHSQRSN